MGYDCYTGGQHLAELEQTARHMITGGDDPDRCDFFSAYPVGRFLCIAPGIVGSVTQRDTAF